MEYLHEYSPVKTVCTFSFLKKLVFITSLFCFVFVLSCLICKQMISSRKVGLHPNYNNTSAHNYVFLEVLLSCAHFFFLSRLHVLAPTF